MIFLKGIITGLILSLPFGPVGIYCMEKAMIEGEKKAYVSALGMVTVDIIYGIISFLFISRVESYVIKFETPLKVLISVFLIVIGSKKFFGKPKVKEVEDDNYTLVQDYFETFLLAIFNISSVLVIAGIYTLLGVLDSPIKEMTVLELSTGIGIGGASLWFTTIFLIYHFKKKVTMDMLLKLSKLSGLVILIFGIATIIFAFYK
ncbi:MULTISPECIES: LysE family transporter [Cetobacterium]|jgi:threonine/homoserine/homoserine lactone efflux protein|uniref:Lysine transporter LysE n=1 Tax=Candidatus Cetobacterium colombiensis TaxID=3073100 RepID=A0ABU4W7U8_9FUSO|nr:LysE family transporter [Candidatus Cetobacterium colombiensis]MDX8335610.1 lysine transporter LysE [Candidatus Cetobacterium colombiensis]